MTSFTGDNASASTGLRQRRGGGGGVQQQQQQQHESVDDNNAFEDHTCASHESVTELPIMDLISGRSMEDVTLIPTADSTVEMPKQPRRPLLLRLPQTPPSINDTSSSDGVDDYDSLQAAAHHATAASSMTGKDVAKDESRLRKMLTRVVSGAGMIGVFCTCVYSGHSYVCMIVALSEFLLFRELVKVRYNAYYTTIQDTIPLFRTTQWTWFFVAIFYTYGDFIYEVIQNNAHLHYLAPYAQYLFTYCAFGLYSGTFVITIATMQTGHIKFQLNQLCWTIVVLCLTVGQMKYIMHNIFNGLFWFTFPFLLVVVNDIMAYVAGITCGRKFIQRPFIKFSPNKTWEGFIGGGIFTMIAAWYLSRALAQYSWMTCPTNEFRLAPGRLDCENHHIFQEAQSVIPAQIFEILPTHLVKMIPGIVEYCSVKNMTAAGGGGVSTHPALERCISGEPSHTFHHVELVLKNVYPVQIHALWLGFFASVVAPFGGFLASAIKRAYGIKDFDSFIPGHGGVTDRLDCQFLMALCTWVHYNTFVKLATVSVPKLIYMYQMLSDAEKRAFVDSLKKTSL